ARGHREAERCSLLGRAAELDPLDRPDRDDHLPWHVVARMWTDRDESVARLRAERFDAVARAVRELDLDERALDAGLGRKLLDPPVDAVDQIVERPGEPGNPEVGHDLEQAIGARDLNRGDVREAEVGDDAATRRPLDEAELEQVRLVDVLDRVRLLAERDGE